MGNISRCTRVCVCVPPVECSRLPPCTSLLDSCPEAVRRQGNLHKFQWPWPASAARSRPSGKQNRSHGHTLSSHDPVTTVAHTVTPAAPSSRPHRRHLGRHARTVVTPAPSSRPRRRHARTVVTPAPSSRPHRHVHTRSPPCRLPSRQTCHAPSSLCRHAVVTPPPLRVRRVGSGTMIKRANNYFPSRPTAPTTASADVTACRGARYDPATPPRAPVSSHPVTPSRSRPVTRAGHVHVHV